MAKKLKAVHPGEILNEEFLAPMKLSQYRLAKEIGVSPRRINEIIKGTRAVTADTALRLSRYFGLSERYWLNLQAWYDIEVEKEKLGDRPKKEVHPLAAYSVLQKSVAKFRLLENAIDSRMRIKAITYRDVRQKPCQFYWHGLLHITIAWRIHLIQRL